MTLRKSLLSFYVAGIKVAINIISSRWSIWAFHKEKENKTVNTVAMISYRKLKLKIDNDYLEIVDL